VPPAKGSAVVFSSGWENMHEVEPLASGTRFAVPSFFTTCAVPPELRRAPPRDDAAVAAELQRSLVAPREAADVRHLMMEWHTLFAEDPADRPEDSA